MKTDVNFDDFSRWFNHNRPNNFTYEGLRALFDYLEEYEEDTEAEIDFDPIAICCEYTEYKDLAEFNDNYGNNLSTLEEVGEYTQVIDIDGASFIIQDY